MLADLADGEATYWEKGRDKVAIGQLTAARSKLVGAVPSADRPAVLRALWLLAQLQLQRGKSAEEVLDHTIRIDPAAAPGLEQFSPELNEAHSRRRVRYLQEARRITVRLVGHAPSGVCRAHVDGVDRGPVGGALGPFAPGAHFVGVVCGGRSSWTRRVSLAGGDLEVAVPAYELGLSVRDGALHVSSHAALAPLEADLLARPAIRWVLTVAAGLDGRVSCRLAIDGRKPLMEPPMAAAAVRGWLDGQMKELDVTEEPQNRPGGSGSSWVQWVLIGGGAAIIGGGVAVHFQGLQALEDTENSVQNRSSELRGYEVGYWSLYGIGGGALIAGAVLAIVSGSDDPPSTIVVPDGAGVSVHGRF